MASKISPEKVWRPGQKRRPAFRASESTEALSAALCASQERVQELQDRLASLETRLERQESLMDDVLGSRIWRTLVAAGSVILRWSGAGAPEVSWLGKGGAGPTRSDYSNWIKTGELSFDPMWVEARIAAFRWLPQFSIVVRDGRNQKDLIDQTIRSLERQSYSQWELLGPGRNETHCDFVVYVDPGDSLSPNALYALAEALNSDPDADLIYTDEDVLHPVDGRCDPYFKPDWSPELFSSENYIGGLLACRTDLAFGVTDGRDYGPDRNLTARLCHQARRIVHLPHVLYHRRPFPTGLVSDKPSLAASRGVSGAGSPRVSILIPTCNRSLVEDAINTIQEKTDYPEYEIVVIDNSRGSSVQRFAARRNLRYCDCREWPFNFARLINHAARSTTSPILLLLNDDTRVVESGWLRALIDAAQKPGVGAVGARLLFPDRTIQHAGVIVGLYGTCGHAFRGLPADKPVYRNLASTAREVSAVTGACLLTHRSCFEECGGLDEVTFPVAYQDVDYCLRLQRQGYRILYAPAATLIHKESASIIGKGIRGTPAELQAFRRRWADVIDNDPYYNPNLTRESPDYRFRAGRHSGL
jgi:O-antigen biosynthesis protein